MPPTSHRQCTKLHAKDSTHPSSAEAGAGHQSQQWQSHICKVRLQMPQLNPSSPDPHGVMPVLPPPLPSPEVHGPLHQSLPPPKQHPQVLHIAADHPALVGSSQYNVCDQVMNFPPSHTHPYMPFYPPAFPQPQYPHIPPHGAGTGVAHLQPQHMQYMSLPTPFLSQFLATQYANTTNVSLPWREVRISQHVQEGTLPCLDARETDGVDHTNAAASSSAEAWSGKTYANKEISKGGMLSVPSQGVSYQYFEVWLFVVEVINNNLKHTFDTKTDMDWWDFQEEVHNCLEKPTSKVAIVYCIGETGAMLHLEGEANWKNAMCQLQGKIWTAWTHQVSMELKNKVSGKNKKNVTHTHVDCSQNGSARASVSKAHGAGKGKGKEKCCCEDDIPPDPDNKTKYQVECLDDLKKYFVCELHSTSGLPVYCWVDPSGCKKEHDPLNHKDMTLWVKHIVSMLRLSTNNETYQHAGRGEGNKVHSPKHHKI